MVTPSSVRISLGPWPPTSAPARGCSTTVAWSFSLRTIGVGHRFPTGDVFRTLSVEVSSPRAPTHFRAVALLGRRYALTPEPQVVIDTTLAPGEVRAVMLGPSSWVERVRLRYHFEPMGGGVEPALVLDEPISALLTR